MILTCTPLSASSSAQRQVANSAPLPAGKIRSLRNRMFNSMRIVCQGYIPDYDRASSMPPKSGRVVEKFGLLKVTLTLASMERGKNVAVRQLTIITAILLSGCSKGLGEKPPRYHVTQVSHTPETAYAVGPDRERCQSREPRNPGEGREQWRREERIGASPTPYNSLKIRLQTSFHETTSAGGIIVLCSIAH